MASIHHRATLSVEPEAVWHLLNQFDATEPTPTKKIITNGKNDFHLDMRFPFVCGIKN